MSAQDSDGVAGDLERGDHVRWWSHHPEHEQATKRDGRIIDIDGDSVTLVWTFSNAGRTFQAEKTVPRSRIETA